MKPQSWFYSFLRTLLITFPAWIVQRSGWLLFIISISIASWTSMAIAAPQDEPTSSKPSDVAWSAREDHSALPHNSELEQATDSKPHSPIGLSFTLQSADFQSATSDGSSLFTPTPSLTSEATSPHPDPSGDEAPIPPGNPAAGEANSHYQTSDTPFAEESELRSAWLAEDSTLTPLSGDDRPEADRQVDDDINEVNPFDASIFETKIVDFHLDSASISPSEASPSDLAIAPPTNHQAIESSVMIESVVVTEAIAIIQRHGKAEDALFEGGSNSLVARAVGTAEGTRLPNGQTTWAYYGHIDPGNAAWNMGSFSYQHGANTPEEADEKQLMRLQQQAEMLRQQAQTQGITLTLEAELNGIDLANQSPQAALNSGGYIDRLREAYNQGLQGSEAILWARVQSYRDPDTQQWNAPGLGNTFHSIQADQQRRQEAIALAMLTPSTDLALVTPISEAPVAVAPPETVTTVAIAPVPDFAISLDLGPVPF
jgi:hypothetical protein